VGLVYVIHASGRKGFLSGGMFGLCYRIIHVY